MSDLTVRFSDACTDVLVHLVDKPEDHWPTPTGIAAEIAPPDADDALRTVCNALGTLRECGLVEGRVVDGWSVFRATDAGRKAVAEARAASQETAPTDA